MSYKKCDIIKDIKLFPKVYCMIYCRKFLMLSNQMKRSKSKCIRKACLLRYIILSLVSASSMQLDVPMDIYIFALKSLLRFGATLYIHLMCTAAWKRFKDIAALLYKEAK